MRRWEIKLGNEIGTTSPVSRTVGGFAEFRGLYRYFYGFSAPFPDQSRMRARQRGMLVLHLALRARFPIGRGDGAIFL